MNCFVVRLVEAAVKGESLKTLHAESPFLTDCLGDHFARSEDIPEERRRHKRAVAVRRHIAFLLGIHQLASKKGQCPFAGAGGEQ